MLRVKIISRLLHLNELLLFFPKLKRFYKRKIAKKSPLILDVGSNRGQTIDFFLKCYKNPVIYGFEPNHDLYEFLIKKYARNKNVIITNCGISDKSGRLIFKETVTDETSTFEELNYDSEYLKIKSRVLGVAPENIVRKTYEVDVVKLSDFLKAKKIGKVDVLKIDTEGHEYKCLQGLFGDIDVDVDYIQLEQHNDDMYTNRTDEKTIAEFLRSYGFEVAVRISHGFGDFDEVIYEKKA